ncbi:MAG: hypothetical protein ACYSR6_00165 [Planctomycetota bacterium]|jgi:hypothetical protein
MGRAKLVQIERELHAQAFEIYRQLGPKRSHKAVANQLGVSVASVKNWSRSFRWRERIAERDAQVAREVANRTLTDDVSRRERNLKIVEMAVIRLARDIRDGRIKTTLADLDRLIRLESFLSDEPDSRPEIIVTDLRDKSDAELREMVRREVETIKELEASRCEIDYRK